MLRQIQNELAKWTEHNFPNQQGWHPVFGLMEELGELAHAHLKQDQGIRMSEDHEANKKDAIGDIVIFLLNYCNSQGYDLEELVQETWDEVKRRDWKKDPVSADKV